MKKLTRIALLLLTFSFHIQGLNAQVVSETQARQTARAFADTKLSVKGEALSLVSADGIYIYNVGGQGFVIVSGDQVLPPILGYSMEGIFPSLDDAPEHVAYWIHHYEAMINDAHERGIQPEPSVLSAWERASRGIFGDRNAASIDPIITTHWDQGCYYNEYCPYTGGSGWWDDGGPCGHAYAGCVACAMAQVMKYWSHPVQGLGSHSYTHSIYGVQSADFGNTTYHWSQMPSEIYYHNDAIATLMYHCGVSVDMNYGAGGSGAQSAAVETALRSYFGYCGARYREKSKYDYDVWVSMLKAELDLLHPMYYSGSSSSAGHAFVCDGYDENDLFHFNFGWSGAGDSFYSLYDVNGYESNQAVVMNIVPLEIRPDNHGIIYVSADGEGNGTSWDQATRHLEFATFLSDGGNNQVWVKKGVYHGEDSDPENAFYINRHNRIYGGFRGDEAPDYDIGLRDLVANASILDGQGVKRVLDQAEVLNQVGQTALWDGFVIRNGHAGSGAGAYLNGYVTFSNCVFEDNTATAFGGGIYVNSTSNGGHSVSLSNCTVMGNTASMGGGLCDRHGVGLTNCFFSNNAASTKGGGLYVFNNATPVLRGCVISNNAAEEGGGLYARGYCQLNNCNIVMNKANQRYGGAFNEDHRNRYMNCILWGNMANGIANQYLGSATFEYCAVQGGVSGEGNIALSAENSGDEPGSFVRFIQPAQGAGIDFTQADWNIHPRSICLNRGKEGTADFPTDLAGHPRVQHGRIEIGAYEKNASLTYMEASVWEGQTYWFNNYPLHEPGYYTTVYHTPTCDSVVGLTLSVLLGVQESSESGLQDVLAVEVFSVLGQSMGVVRNENKINELGLKPGCYLLRIQTIQGILSKKIIVP